MCHKRYNLLVSANQTLVKTIGVGGADFFIIIAVNVCVCECSGALEKE